MGKTSKPLRVLIDPTDLTPEFQEYLDKLTDQGHTILLLDNPDELDAIISPKARSFIPVTKEFPPEKQFEVIMKSVRARKYPTKPRAKKGDI